MSKIITSQNIKDWYSDGYSKYPFFTDRASEIESRFTDKDIKILIAGCGAGYLVEELHHLGFSDVWGCDASAYMVNLAQTALVAEVRPKILLADITSPEQLNNLTQTAELPKFDLIITEDVLPMMDEETEAETALTELRKIGTELFHIITCSNGNDQARVDGLWKTVSDWKELIGSEPVWSTETGEII